MNTAQAVKIRSGDRQIGLALLVAYVALYAVLLLAMRRSAAFDITEPLMVLAILGVGFSLAAWLLTLHVHPLDYPVVKPKWISRKRGSLPILRS